MWKFLQKSEGCLKKISWIAKYPETKHEVSPDRVFRAEVPDRILIAHTTLLMVWVEVVLVEIWPWRPKRQSHNQQMTQTSVVLLGRGGQLAGLVVVVAAVMQQASFYQIFLCRFQTDVPHYLNRSAARAVAIAMTYFIILRNI
jgi:hypothetical protein